MLKNKGSITLIAASAAMLISGCNTVETQSANANQSLSVTDYQRAEQQLRAHTKPLVVGTVEQQQWLADGKLLYRTAVTDGHQFVLANAIKGQKVPAFDHQAIANALSTADKQYSATSLPFKSFKFIDNQHKIVFAIDQQSMQCSLEPVACQIIERSATVSGEILSPDGTKAAYIKDHNLWLRDTLTDKHTQLTVDGQQDYGYGTNNAGWLRSDKPVLLWSPDSSKIATFQHDSRQVKSMHLVSTNVGHPTLDSWKYPLPGDKDIFMLERVIIDVTAKSVTRLNDSPDYQRSTVTDHIYDAGKMLDVQWDQASTSLAYVSVSRDHSQATLKVANVSTGQVNTILDEKASSFFESGMNQANWYFLPKSNEVLWFSQRSDWGHLYLYQLDTGKLKHAVTQGEWNVLQVRHIDQDKRQIFFTGAGREAGDPYYQYFYKIGMDGKGLTLLTPENANHVIQLSHDKEYFVDNFSTPSQANKVVIRDVTAREIMELERTDISALTATHWRAPQAFVVKDRNGNFDIHGLMYKPSNFDPKKSYPVINYLYPGPQTGSIGSRSFRASRGDKQAMAELGFILIEIDALGTPMRSKSFHEFYYGNMGDSGVPDQIAAIKQLASQYPWIDLDRVGIWGHSGGGFASTNAILKYPEFYKVAVSGAGNHDNRNYADPWGEKWQGLVKENADGTTNYDNQANQLIVDGLKGKLLLAHGTLDDNVPPFNTLVVVDALIAANKDFDLLMLPNRGHGFSREPYMMRKRWDYFVTHLMGKTPPKEFNFAQ